MNKSDPVFAGLAEGLRPADALDDDTFRVDLDALRAAERLRIVKALEKQTELAERQTTAAERAADATERAADAFEVIASLLASVTGVGKAYCYPGMSDGEITQQPVNFLRTGNGSKAFACDQSNAESSDDDE